MQITVESLRKFRNKLANDPYVDTFYAQFPRNVFWEAENKSVSNEILSSAAELTDLIHRMQQTYLFSVNTDDQSKSLAISWLISKYKELGIEVESLPPQVEEAAVSNPAISMQWAGRRLSIDFLRTLSVASDIKSRIQRSRGPLHVVELGAGLGHLARTMRLMGVSRTHLIFDLPESLVFSCAFLAANFPDASICLISDINEAREVKPSEFDFVFVPSCFAEFVNIDSQLFVNTASLGEMRNETIRYWMTLVQSTTSIKYLFTQNRFLNTIDPGAYAWRYQENEASVHYDAKWTILKWELEPAWYRCPYIAPISARCLEIAAERNPEPPVDAAIRAKTLVSEVMLEDWFRFSHRPKYMSMLQNAFVVDVGMSGALFKIWESIRLYPTAEAVLLMRRYLSLHLHQNDTEFEEARYYDQLLLQLGAQSQNERVRDELAKIANSPTQEPRMTNIKLIGETRSYNLVAAKNRAYEATPLYFAIAKCLGPTNLFQEFLGERALPPYLFLGRTPDEVRRLAELQEANVS